MSHKPQAVCGGAWLVTVGRTWPHALAFVTGLTSRPTVDRLRLWEVAGGNPAMRFPVSFSPGSAIGPLVVRQVSYRWWWPVPVSSG
jgi:hypothetical protein